MSRIGKKPITVPAGVTVTEDSAGFNVKGPKGALSQHRVPGITLQCGAGVVNVLRSDDTKQQRAYHGLIRSLLQNMVTGVSTGFTTELEIYGIGYKAEVSGSKLVMNLGFSHPIEYPVPVDVAIKAEKTNKKTQNYSGTITLTGIDRQRVGQVAAEIRGFRPPDSYKGKGIRYLNEIVKLKEGKKTA